MNAELLTEVLWKVSCILGLSLALHHLLKNSPAVAKHALLLTTVLACLVLPCVTLWVPGIKVLPARMSERPVVNSGQSHASKVAEIPVKPSPIVSRSPGHSPQALAPSETLSAVGSENTLAVTREEGSEPSWLRILIGVWLGGVALLSVRLALSQWRLRAALGAAIAASAQVRFQQETVQQQFGIASKVDVLVSPQSRGPLTLGLLRPKVLLPTDSLQWTADETKAVLAHELMHVKRWDILSEWFRAAFRVLYWFHPLAHVVSVKLQAEQELACDDGVVSLQSSPAEYAACLVKMAPIQTASAAVQCQAGSKPRLLETRVLAILDKNRSRVMRLPRGHCLLVVLLSVASVLLGAGLASVDTPRSAKEEAMWGAVSFRSRAEFAAAMSRVGKGMPSAEVREILGAPDDIKTHDDPGGISASRTKEIWRYGTNGHLTKATLGEVYIDTKDQAQYVIGTGAPIAEGLVEEGKLREYIRLIDRSQSYNEGQRFNPLHLIRAVNALQPLGKKIALAVLSEHLRVSSGFYGGGREGVFLILRALFDVPKTGFMKRMLVGASTPPFPKQPKRYPRFPLHIHKGLPLLLSSGYLLAGFPEQAEQHLAYFEKIGVMRAGPIVPPEQPAKVLLELMETPHWIYNDQQSFLAGPARGANLVGNQVLRMMRSVHRLKASRYGSYLPYDNLAKAKTLLEEASQVDTAWDAAVGLYRLSDGSILPPEVKVASRRFQWKPASGGVINILVERQSAGEVEVTAGLWGTRDPCVIDVRHDAKPNEAPLASLEFAASSSEATPADRQRRSAVLKLPKGTIITIDLKVGGLVTKSKVVKL